MRLVWVAAAALLALASEAAAHGRSVSYSTWIVGAEGAEVELRLAWRDLATRGIDEPERYAAARLRLMTDAAACTPGGVERRASSEGWLTLAWRIRCDGAPWAIENQLFLDGPGARLHFARIRGRNGGVTQHIFAPGERLVALAGGGAAPGPASESAGVVRYLHLGMEHILSGWDHLAFLAGLLVLAGSLRDVVTLATGFTIGHSVTLAVSVLGVARPEGAAVEALIGFSILLVAAENAWLVAGRGQALPALVAALLVGAAGLALGGLGAVSATTMLGLACFAWCHFALLGRVAQPGRLRAAVAFGFGLVHGFGFAGILHEAHLSSDAVVPALFGFNVGVELGQLAAIVVVWPVMHLVARVPRRARRMAEVVSALLAALGTYWFVGRTYGG